jgi:hypothetical protein
LHFDTRNAREFSNGGIVFSGGVQGGIPMAFESGAMIDSGVILYFFQDLWLAANEVETSVPAWP